MLIVHVHIRVKPEHREAFVTATLINARASVRESGIARFECIQEADEPTHFLLIEIYRTAEDPARHKATTHYAAWRDAVEPMMAEPRRSVKYVAVTSDSGSP